MILNSNFIENSAFLLSKTESGCAIFINAQIDSEFRLVDNKFLVFN